MAKNEQQDTKGITIKKDDDIAEWYSQVVIKGEVAEHSAVSGCMVIRPTGMRIWEEIQTYFNELIKAQGVQNATFPMFIPESFFKREAEHAKGFNPEVAWIEKKSDEGERYAVRPTSETIISDSFSKWVRSWRDLPLKINQWCNICRWEVSDCKLFLRSREFLWQEGHCIYETKKECTDDVQNFLDAYIDLSQNLLAVPVLTGKKSVAETFPGADYTLGMEASMPDGKSLQMGTSHYLGQGFMKVFNVSFIGKDEKEETPHYNSWGVSTRLIGGMIMTHSDDKGLVLPPKVAPNKAAIVPIIFEKTKEVVLEACKELAEQLKEFDIILDDREEYSSGYKFNEYELKGVPIRIEIGPKDVEKKQCVFVFRDNGEKKFVPLDNIKQVMQEELDAMQKRLFDKAKQRLDESIVETSDWDELIKHAKDGKVVIAPFCNDPEVENELKASTQGITSRVIVDNKEISEGTMCISGKKPATCYAYFARAY